MTRENFSKIQNKIIKKKSKIQKQQLEIFLQWKNLNIWVPDEDQHDYTIENCFENCKLNQSDQNRFRTKKYKQIIHDSFGFVKPGELVAILGPSGSGKTTLLKYFGQRFERSADILISKESMLLINNQEYTREQFQEFGSFTEQDDIMWESSTPRELFDFALSLKTNYDHNQRNEKVQEFINLLGLQECVDTPVGGKFIKGLSGGERKRTSIGYDLIKNPNLCILDEPTSGLDSNTALKVIKYLKKLSKSQNSTVICSIHMPSSELLIQFDRIICLNEGKIIYNGKATDIKQYFQNYFKILIPNFTNPSDFLINLCIQPQMVKEDLNTEQLVQMQKQSSEIEFIQYINKKEKKSLLQQQMFQNKLQKRENPKKHILQIKELFYRTLMIVIKSPQIFFSLIGIAVFVSFLLISIYSGIGAETVNAFDMQKSKNSVMNWIGFTSYLNQDCFASCFFANIVSLPIYNPIYRREVKSGLYSTHMYYLGNWICKAIFLNFYPVLLITIIFPFLKLPDESNQNFYLFIRNGALQSLNAMTLGHAWGAIFDNEMTALISGFGIMIFSTAGQGQIIARQSQNFLIKSFSCLSPMTYTVELYFKRLMSKNSSEMYFVQYFNFNKGEWYCECVLILQTILFLFIGWYAMWWKTKYRY